MSDLVSIIMPSYNTAQYITEAPHETIEIPKFDKNSGGGISFACSMDFGFRL